MSTRLLMLSALLLTLMTPTSGASDHEAGGIVPEELLSGLNYRMVGPSRGGRVTAVAGHREEPATFYLGASGGGVWKTNNYGGVWFNVSDGFFATGSIGAIRVADSDPNVVYVGTGSDGLRSNVIIGKGVYRSDDAGSSWIHVGLEKVGNIGAVLIHPEDPQLVYVAAIGNPFTPNPERGVFRSKDGGGSWEKVLYLSDKTGAVDLEFAPDDPSQIYATMWTAERKPWTIISGGLEGGIFKSENGGDNWRQLTEGLPTGLRGKADLAVSSADPNRVYLLMEAPAEEGGLYRSDDRGETWCQVTANERIRTRPFYYCNLEAHPTDPDTLWAMSEGFWRSSNGGQSWKRQSVPHGDNHDLWINPDKPNLYIQANDGGANVTLDDGKTWSTQYNQPTAELYQVDISDDFPYRLYAGQQDNSTISVPSLPPRSMPGGHTALWEDQGGCETGPAVPKPGDPDIVFANCKGRFGVFNRRTGQEQQHYVGFGNLYGHNPKDLSYRFQRVSPIHVSPHNPNRVYHGSQFVHVTEDGGKTWEKISPDLTAFDPETQVVSGTPITIDVTGEEHFSTLYEIQESPHEPGVIWVGANDGPIHVTKNGGRTWKNVTPKELGPYGRVQTIEVSPHDAAKTYVSVLRYQLGDFSPYVFKTEDYGESWQRISSGDNGIPADFPVRVVREDPKREGLLYAGTEFGMFVSFDDGTTWQPFQLNLPVTPVTDIKRVNNDLVLSTMGRSFWILYDVTPLHEASAQLASRDHHLFDIADAYRVYAGGRWRSPSSSPERPQYPPVGVHINYWLKNDVEETIRLEILDSDGLVVREFKSEQIEKPESPDDPDEIMNTPSESSRPAPPDQLNTRAGLFRFVWDMRHEGPWNEESEDEEDEKKYSDIRGPMAPPGIYQARLTIGSWTSTRSFRLELDPRIAAEGITSTDVESQEQLTLEIRTTVSLARQTAEKLKVAIEEAKTTSELEVLLAHKDRLITKPIRYSQPKLLDQLEYLYRNLIGADQTPSKDARERFAELKAELHELVEAM